MYDSDPRPQAPLPPEIYRRRRVAALVVGALVVLAVIGALLLSSRDDGTDTATDTSAAAEPGEAEASGSSTAPGPGASPTSGASGSSSAPPAGPSRGRCGDNDLGVRVTPATPNAPAGAPLVFVAEIENSTPTTCDRDLVGAPLAFEVYRLDDNSKVWSSVDCTAPSGEDKVVFEPGKPVRRQIDWSGRVSAPGACQDADRVPAELGPYQVYALVGKVFSPAATFNLVK